MSTEYWHPTPIFYFDLPKNQTEIIFKEISNVLNSNKLELHKNSWGDYLNTSSTNIFKEFNLINSLELFNFYVKTFLKEVDYNCNFNIDCSWLNFLPPKGFQNKHTHTNLTPKDLCLCSAVYYYDINTLQNEFDGVVFDLSSNLGFYNTAKEIFYNYVPGRLIIFSSTVPHFVKFNNTQKTRTSLSFNVKELNE